jgi:WD40 repeat protein
MQNKDRFQNLGLSGMNLLLFAEHYFYSIFASLKALERIFPTGCENLQIIKRLPLIPVSSQSRKVLNSDGFLVIKLMQRLISYKGRCAVTNPVGLLRCILFHSVAFDPTGRFVATGSDDNTAKVWRMSPDGAAATCVATLAGHSSRVRSVAFDPTGRFVATGSL